MAAKCKVFRALGVKLRVCCSRDRPRNMEVSISIFFPSLLPRFLMFNQSFRILQKLNCWARCFWSKLWLVGRFTVPPIQAHNIWFGFLWSFFHKWHKAFERSKSSELKYCCSFLALLLNRPIFYFPFLTFIPPSASVISTAVVICFINCLCLGCFCPECILFGADVLPKPFPVLWWCYKSSCLTGLTFPLIYFREPFGLKSPNPSQLPL